MSIKNTFYTGLKVSFLWVCQVKVMDNPTIPTLLPKTNKA